MLQTKFNYNNFILNTEEIDIGSENLNCSTNTAPEAIKAYDL